MDNKVTTFNSINHGLYNGDIVSLSGRTGTFTVSNRTTSTFQLSQAGVRQYFPVFNFTMTLLSRAYAGVYKITSVLGNMVTLEKDAGIGNGVEPKNVLFATYATYTISAIRKLDMIRHVSE